MGLLLALQWFNAAYPEWRVWVSLVIATLGFGVAMTSAVLQHRVLNQQRRQDRALRRQAKLG